MKLQAILTNKMSVKPTKKKIIKTVYLTEKLAQEARKYMPENSKFIAENVSEGCNKLRAKLLQQ